MAVTYKNPGKVEFSGIIHRLEEGGGAYVEFPHDVEKLYGFKGRVPVKVTFDGIPYRGSMVKMGTPCHILLILKEIRERLGKGGGDKIKVTVELDEAPRVVELSAEVEAAFRKAGVLEKFRSLSFTHQREYSRSVEEAKQPETRRRRLEKSIAELRGKTLRAR
jgi:hypothetical protein